MHTHRVDKSGLRPPQLKQFSDSQKLPKMSDHSIALLCPFWLDYTMTVSNSQISVQLHDYIYDAEELKCISAGNIMNLGKL